MKDTITIHTERKHLRKHLRKASWLIDQVRLSLPENEHQFAESLADVNRHFIATCQHFFKSNLETDRTHDEHPKHNHSTPTK